MDESRDEVGTITATAPAPPPGVATAPWARSRSISGAGTPGEWRTLDGSSCVSPRA